MTALSAACSTKTLDVGSAGAAVNGTASNGDVPTDSITGGAGIVSLEVDRAPSGTRSVLDAYFNHGVETSVGNAFGDCVFDPNGARRTQSGVVGAPAPNPGQVVATAPNFTLSTKPGGDGTYALATSDQSFAPADLVAFAWTPPLNGPDTFPAALPAIPAPHLVSLPAGQSFAASAPTLARSSDVPLSWTVTGTPLALEQVVVVLTQGVATVTCAFAAHTGSGVVPADALLELRAAETKYAVVARHVNDVVSQGWQIRFVVDAAASTPVGLAEGTLSLE